MPNNAIGISGSIALVTAFIFFRPKAVYAVKDCTRLTDNVGVTGILPQVLAALGSVFTAAGVGDVIAGGVSAIIPAGNLFAATAVYCIAMALFTMIMGNGFAAFSVITVGIGIPFLIAQGADPVVVGALGLTAGYCGTLMTPMAANFNILPAALLETKNKYIVILSQLPFLKFWEKYNRAYLMEGEDLSAPVEIEFCTGSFSAVRTAEFKAVGGFDEHYFMYVEDADLTQKMRTTGKAYLVPQYTAIHAWHRAAHRSLKPFLWQTGSLLRYFHKWGFKF